MNQKIKEKKIDYGLSILRSVLAFYVIRSHCLGNNIIKNKFLFFIFGKRRRVHVPTFFIMSFYFNFKALSSINSKIISKRFERLLIPYIFWPIIVFSINNIISKYFGFNLKCSFKTLIIQLIFGFGIISPLYFQFCLIITTFLFLFVLYLFKNYYLCILNLLMMFAYFLQYSKYLSNAFSQYKLEFHYSIDRELELIPYAITGLNLKAFNIINNLKQFQLQTFIFSLIIFFFVDNFDVISVVNDYYSGIKLNVLSINLILIFSSLFPSEIFQNKYIKYFVEYITRYTAGIYYLHIPIYSYFSKYIISMKKGTIGGLFMIYIISYSICHLGMLLSGKTKARNLFS